MKIKQNSQILVTGGLGYIGSHTVAELIATGYQVVIFDNLTNSHPGVLDNLETISGQRPQLVIGDVTSAREIDQVFQDYQIAAVIHFAGLKSVSESLAQPLKYFENNVTGTINLLKAMAANNVYRHIFSSSATVYGAHNEVPFKEEMSRGATNPYGRSKLMVEDILKDLSNDPTWKIVALRYFNPVGAHPSGLLGEEPKGIPNNLMPYLVQAASGRLKELQVFGNDYETKDGTGVRDYIHVVDLAKAHVAVLSYMIKKPVNFEVFNVGTGHGISVLEMIDCFEKTNNIKVPFKIVERRPGDVGEAFADVAKIKDLVGWNATHSLEDMCKDAWNWEQKNK